MLELIKVTKSESLSRLLGMLCNDTLPGDVESWIERVYTALEDDCQVDAASVDLMAEILEDLRFAPAEGEEVSDLATELLEVYHRAMSPERRWFIRRDCLTDDELRTELWQDFQEALALCQSGDLESAECWAEEADQSFARAWEQYAHMPITEEEIALESSLGHRFLKDGIEAWRSALGALRASIADGVERSEEMLALAREGQKSLVIVQMLERELRWSQTTFAGPELRTWAA